MNTHKTTNATSLGVVITLTTSSNSDDSSIHFIAIAYESSS